MGSLSMRPGPLSAPASLGRSRIVRRTLIMIISVVTSPLQRSPSDFVLCGSQLLIGTFLNGACTWSHWTFVVPLQTSVLVLACLLFFGRLFFIATTMWVRMSLSPTMLTSSAWCWKINAYIILPERSLQSLGLPECTFDAIAQLR